MVIVTEAPFTTSPTHTITGMRSMPQTPRETNLVNMHIKMHREVDKIFAGHPLDPRGKGSRPPRPS